MKAVLGLKLDPWHDTGAAVVIEEGSRLKVTAKQELSASLDSEKAALEFTGERFVTELKGQIAYEHFHRYAFACELVKDKKVLDIASGEGYGSALLSHLAQEVVGVDISNQAIDHARKKYGEIENLSFCQGECKKIPCNDNYFDLVVSFETLEHIKEQNEFLSEVKRVLKKDGILVISSPNKKIYSDEKTNYTNEYHEKELYLDELEDLLGKYFKDVKFFGQRLTFSSHIWQLISNGKTSFTHYAKNGKLLTSEQQPPFEAEYFLAVCSDEKNSTAFNTSLLTAHDDELFHDYTDRGLWGQNLSKELEAKNIELERLKTQQGKEGKHINSEFIDSLIKIELLIEKNQLDEAEKAINELSDYKNELELKNRFIKLEILRGNLFDAEYMIQEIKESNPANKSNNLNYQLLAEKRNSLKTQKSWTSKKSAANMTLAENMIHSRKLDEAEKILLEIINIEPQHLEAMNDLAVVYILREQYENAYNILGRVLLLDEANEIAIGNLGYLGSVTDLDQIIGSFSNASKDDYDDKVKKEIEFYAEVTNIHDLPKIHHTYANKFISPSLNELTGFENFNSWWVDEINKLTEQKDEAVKILSLGCGNGDTEIEFLKKIRNQDKIRFLGLDINRTMIGRANKLAEESGLHYAEFKVHDLNKLKLSEPYDVFIANHSLHHIVKLEHMFEEIVRQSTPEMIFLINDMIGRNGHVMWDGAKIVTDHLWQQIDKKYKLNAYDKVYDDDMHNMDCSQEGFEGIRAQDILPLLIKYFAVDVFLPFATFINRFSDRTYGHNFNVNDENDVALFLELLDLDVELLKEKKLAATQALMKVVKKGRSAIPRYLFQSPEETVAIKHNIPSTVDYEIELNKVIKN